ncbi:hypothetical protein DB346_22860 [Verrucomicrobia bacterium LW23]|nr:hypothetical protein DB346_22860 [Verrucomicrobia bacterium LW23]
MKALSMDVRERIVSSDDEGTETQEQVAARYRVSFAVVKKLLALRRRTGSVAPVGHRGGRKSMFTPARRRLISHLVRHLPDITLAELREALGLTCALSTLHYVLVAMGLTFKKDVARGRAGAR